MQRKERLHRPCWTDIHIKNDGEDAYKKEMKIDQ